jgi:hypothetical protein
MLILSNVKLLAANLGCFNEFLKIWRGDRRILEADVSGSFTAYLERGQFVIITGA